MYSSARRSMMRKRGKVGITDEWMNKMGSSHTAEYYLAIRRNKVMIRAAWICDLKTLCSVKDASYKRLHSIGFRLCIMSKIGNSMEIGE